MAGVIHVVEQLRQLDLAAPHRLEAKEGERRVLSQRHVLGHLQLGAVLLLMRSPELPQLELQRLAGEKAPARRTGNEL